LGADKDVRPFFYAEFSPQRAEKKPFIALTTENAEVAEKFFNQIKAMPVQELNQDWIWFFSSVSASSSEQSERAVNNL
jgi:hypothetical protein